MSTKKIKTVIIPQEEDAEDEFWADYYETQVSTLTAKVKNAKILFENTLSTLLFAEEHQFEVIRQLKEAKKNRNQVLKYVAKKKGTK